MFKVLFALSCCILMFVSGLACRAEDEPKPPEGGIVFTLKDGTSVIAASYRVDEINGESTYFITRADRSRVSIPATTVETITRRKSEAASIIVGERAAPNSDEERKKKAIQTARAQIDAQSRYNARISQVNAAKQDLMKLQAQLDEVEMAILVVDAKITGFKEQLLIRMMHDGRRLEYERAIIERAKLEKYRKPLADLVAQYRDKHEALERQLKTNTSQSERNSAGDDVENTPPVAEKASAEKRKVILKNGTILNGEIQNSPDGDAVIIKDVLGQQSKVLNTQIQSIESEKCVRP